ncbi:MAG: hypothetical protein ACREP8_10110 [Candidatus Binatia bacterium]
MVKPLSVIKIRKLFCFLLALGLGVSVPWALAGGVSGESSLENHPGILREATDQGFRYMSGGVGLEEREVMESWGANYNLKLTFAGLSGHYLSDVRIVIQDSNGKEIISTVTNGPWLYVQVSPGVYDIKATFEGETREIQNLRVPEGQRVSRFFHWDLDQELKAHSGA